MQITSQIPSDPLHQTYNAQNRGAQTEYLAIVKMSIKELHVKDINFAVQLKWEEYMDTSWTEVSFAKLSTLAMSTVHANKSFIFWMGLVYSHTRKASFQMS